jgi:hypothetical protein
MPETSIEAKTIEHADHFIGRVLSPEYVRNLMSEVGCDIRCGVFHPVMTIWLMMYQRISGKKSLAQALAAFQRGVGGVLMERGNRLPNEVSLSTGGLSQARTRIPEEAVEAMVDTLNATIIGSHSEHLWHGRNAYVLDGTDFRALAEGDIRKEYPPSRDDKRSSSWSTIRSVIATHVITGVAVRPESGAMYGPKAVGEVGLSTKVIGRLPEHSVIVADRGLGTFFVAFNAINKGHDVLVRLTDVRARQALDGKLPKTDCDTRCVWQPAKKTQQSYSIDPNEKLHGRIIRHTYLKNGSRPVVLYLFTTLELPVEELLSLYTLRWNIELDLRTLKTAMKMETLDVKSASMARKEIAVGVCAYNMVRHLLAYSAHQANMSPRSISFSRYAYVIMYSGLAALSSHCEDSLEFFNNLSARLHQIAHPKRRKPRPSRPRKVHRKPRPFPAWTTNSRKGEN